MNSRWSRGAACGALVGACVGLASSTLAQDAVAPAAQPESQPVAGRAEALAVMARAIKAYAALDSYSDRMVLDFEISGEQNGQPIDQTQSQDTAFFYEKPNRFLLIGSDEFKLYSDGTTVTTHMVMFEQYTQAPVPATGESLDWAKYAGPFGEMIPMSHPVVTLAIGAVRDPAKMPMVENIDSVKSEARDGRPGKLVAVEFRSPKLMGPPSMIPATLWFSDETGLLEVVTMDLADTYRRMYSGLPPEMAPLIKKASVTLTARDMKLNEDVPDDMFVFKPGEDDLKVESFDDPFGNMGDMDEDPEAAAQKELIGKPAPSFAGTGLDGKALSLEAYRGKIVVVDFWATWCPPCIAAMPHLQELSKAYEGKGVVVIGINQDAEEDRAAVEAFIKERSITFRQFLDADSAVGDLYHVSGIPTTVIIDAKGVVQAIHIGFIPGYEKKYAEQLDTLLRGEDLYEKE